MIKKLISILVLAILLTTPFFTSISAVEIESNNVDAQGLFEEYVIQDVPYIPQQEFGCAYACVAMIFAHHGKDSSMMKNYYYCGAGYSFAYPRTLESIITLPVGRPPYFFQFLSSGLVNQGDDDWDLMASLNGAEQQHHYASTDFVINHIKEWNNWWTEVKGYIKNDNPVMTSIDPLAWPIWQEYTGMSKTPLFNRAGHAIVIVGFNEKNQSICVQDPMAGSPKFYTPDRVGYQWIKLNIFRRALRRSFWDLTQNSYEVCAFVNITETPDFDDAFRIAHARNIEKLKGNKSAYDQNLIAPQFKEFGVDALRTLRQHYNSLRFYLLFPFFKKMAEATGPGNNSYPFGWNSGWHKHEAAVHREISKFLIDIKPELTDENLTKICDYESVLFHNASEKFYELANTTVKLQDLLYNETFFTMFLEARSILKDVVSVIDEILVLQEAIIAGPSEEA